jgi:hypothetical protein
MKQDRATADTEDVWTVGMIDLWESRLGCQPKRIVTERE